MLKTAIRTLSLILLTALFLERPAHCAQPVVDGSLTDISYTLLGTSAGGPTPGFGAGHEINALYGFVNNGVLALGLAGNVQNGNRIIVFIDCKTGGYSNGDFGRDNAPPGLNIPDPMATPNQTFNKDTTFDDGFSADYALVIGVNSDRSAFSFDLCTLSGSYDGGGGTVASISGSKVAANPANSNQTKGFEASFTYSLNGASAELTVNQPDVKLFALYMREDGYVSNQFISHANADNGNYTDAAINFNLASPNPVVLTRQVNHITSTVPAQFEAKAAANTPVTVNFERNIDPATAVFPNLAVYGSLSGLKQSTITIPLPNKIVITPKSPFLPGEKVTVTVSRAILTPVAEAASPRVIEFTVAAPSGVGVLQPAVTNSNFALGCVSVSLADLNGDGYTDALVVGKDGKTGVWLNDGNAAFTQSAATPLLDTSAQIILSGDLNGDGKPDMLALNTGDLFGVWLNYGGLYLSGAFGGGTVSGGVLTDVDCDGDLDLVTVSPEGQTSIWLNDGTGLFSTGAVFGERAYSIASGDLNGDGLPDLAIGGTNVSVYLNDGRGGFTKKDAGQGNSASALLVADVNGNGVPDLITIETGSVYAYLNDGTGTLAAPVTIGTPGSVYISVASGDLNGDGFADLLLCTFNSAETWLNSGSGVFTLSGQAAVNDPRGTAIAALNKSGGLDAIAATGDNALVLINRAANRPPVIAPVADKTVDEGSALAFQITGSDPDFNTLVFSLADGAPNGATITPQGFFSYIAADGPFSAQVTVVLTETDENPNFTVNQTFNITVNNVAPKITLTGTNSVSELATYTLNIGTPVDPGTDKIYATTIDWGDGNVFLLPAMGDVYHTYAVGTSANSPVTITVSCMDEDGTFIAAIKTLAVTPLPPNSAPQITDPGAQNVDEGSTLSLQLAYTDGQNNNAVFSLAAGAPAGTSITAAGKLTYSAGDGPDTVTVSVKITETNGLPSNLSSTLPVVINVLNVAPAVTITGADTVKEGGTYTLNVGAIADPGTDTLTVKTIHWGDGGDTPFTTPGDYTHVYAIGSAGVKTISVELRDEDGQYPAAATKTLIVDSLNKPPVANDGQLSISEDTVLNASLIANDPENGPITFQIISQPEHGELTLNDIMSGAFTYQPAQNFNGTDSITFKAKDASGLESTVATVHLTILPVNDVPVITAHIVVTPVNPHAGQVLQFSAAASDADNDSLTYLWQFGDGTTASGDSPAHTYAQSGDFTVTLQISDGTATVTDTYALKLNGPPSITSAILATPASPYIEQQTQFSIGTSDPDSDPLTYLWSFGDGLTSSLTSPSHSYGTPGEYTVSVTVNDNVSGQAVATQKITIKADALPVTKLVIKLNFAKTGFDGLSFSSSLPLSVLPISKPLVVDVGGIRRTLSLDTKGKGTLVTVKETVTVAFAKPKKGLSAFAYKIVNGNLSPSLTDEGMLNKDTVKAGESTPVIVTVIYDGAAYRMTVPQLYKAKMNKSGVTKQ